VFLQHWSRPWALLAMKGLHSVEARGPATAFSPLMPGWLCVEDYNALRLDGRRHGGIADFKAGQNREVVALPLPLRHGMSSTFTAGDKGLVLDWHGLPERPADSLVPADEAQRQAKVLLDRVKAVWARIREVEEALATPVTMWQRLQDIWLSGRGAIPEMDSIVQQARELPPILEHLDKAPRRVLRRTSRMIPLSRVQEMDRKAMLWLARQPGETMAERAGDRQRIQAVAREENFDTLENRVLLSYARLAREIAHEYAERYRDSDSGRMKQVSAYDKRCRQLENDLLALGVRAASSDVTPNFVLQNNWHYRQVWVAWHKLLQRHRVLDDLWRWQARSWEELCALITIVAAQSIPGAKPVALSPVTFRDEQDRGCWIQSINPVAVFFLEQQQVVLEISYRPSFETFRLLGFGAEIWLRVGRLDHRDTADRWAIWPLWSAAGGLEPGEAAEIGALLPYGRQEKLRGGITLRPAPGTEEPEVMTQGQVSCLTLGTVGKPLAEGIRNLRHVIMRQVAGGTG
jgi:hypothetical protein